MEVTAAGKSLPSIKRMHEQARVIFGGRNGNQKACLRKSFLIFSLWSGSEVSVASCGRFTNTKYASVDLTLAIERIWKCTSELWSRIKALLSSYYSLIQQHSIILCATWLVFLAICSLLNASAVECMDWWIRGCMSRQISRPGNIIKISFHVIPRSTVLPVTLTAQWLSLQIWGSLEVRSVADTELCSDWMRERAPVGDHCL